ncbi:hypothetical protein C0995_011608 [Termitomyces sp. Mi166|nr:hypothetical protein C0995_011608 [Termitomyces sp. Mi166\
MSFATGADDWSPPTSPVNTHTTAPSPGTAGQASGTPPVPGEGPSATPVGTAKYWARVSQMELMITSIMARLAVIEDGLQIASVTARKAPQPSKVPSSASKAPSPSSKTPTAPTSRIPRRTPLAIPLAWELPPTDGQARRYECALEIPDSLVSHVIGHQGRGLKQAHDLSGSRLAAFAVGPAGNEGRRFVTIRGTDQQIGEALVVIGKRIAKRRVRTAEAEDWQLCAEPDTTSPLYSITLGCYPRYSGYSVISSSRKSDGDWSSDVCHAFGLWLTNGHHVAYGPIYPDTWYVGDPCYILWLRTLLWG